MFKFVMGGQSDRQTYGRMDTGMSLHRLKLFTRVSQKHSPERCFSPVLFSFHYFWHAGVIFLGRFQMDLRAQLVTQLKAEKVFHEFRLFEYNLFHFKDNTE